jgi:uncharacterized SAM-binding protein YcdF (DUF218 family)
VVTGGAGKITGTLRSEPEGVRYAAVVRAMGVPGDRLVVERHATNTGENLLHARTLLAERGVWPRSAIIACKPSMTRRALHASAAQWPEVAWQVSAPAIAFESYPSPDVPEDLMISLLVGDLQRMWVYAERGFQTPALVPPDVHEAFEELVRLGYDEFVIDGDAVPG